MRAVFSALSLLFVGMIGCTAVEDPPASPAQSTTTSEVTAADEQRICPFICGLGTLCQYPDGSCSEACNPCLCMRAGGTVVTSCPYGAAAPASPAPAALAAPAAGDSPVPARSP